MQQICTTNRNNIFLDNATRECLADGFWNNLTDYTMCKELCVVVDAMNQTMYSECDVEKDVELDISLHVYFAGSLYPDYTVSLQSLYRLHNIFGSTADHSRHFPLIQVG